MSRKLMFASSLAVLALAIGLVGCANEKQQPSSSPAASPAPPPEDSGSGEQPAAMEHAGHEHAGGDHAEHEVADPKVQEALAKLSPEDRALAEKQKTCPVSDEPLGSMGVPVKVNVKGQDVFLCCESCEGMIKENTDEYLAKLK
jgi:hypothetical protein